MSDGSVNVRENSSQDKRWTIMAALLGTNTAALLFKIEQAKSDNIREFALAVIAAVFRFSHLLPHHTFV